MDLKLTRNSTKINIKFYDGISLTQFQELTKRWDDILSIVQKELVQYVNDDNLCFNDTENSFPIRSRLTGSYYIDTVSYSNHVHPNGFQIMISTRLTEHSVEGETDYLGLEITLFTKSVNDIFEVWGIDSHSI